MTMTATKPKNDKSQDCHSNNNNICCNNFVTKPAKNLIRKDFFEKGFAIIDFSLERVLNIIGWLPNGASSFGSVAFNLV